MEAEIKAGAKLDMLTKSELQEVIDGLDFNVKIGRGVKFRRVQHDMSVRNGYTIEEGIGPEAGFTWAVTFWNSYSYDITDVDATQYIGLFLNSVSPITMLTYTSSKAGLNTNPVSFNFKQSLIIKSGDVLIPQFVTQYSNSSPIAQNIFHVIEVPTFSEGLLNL